MSSLKRYRELLDDADCQIVHFIEKRLSLSKEIGNLKKLKGVKPLNQKERARRIKLYGVLGVLGKSIYKLLHEASLRNQK